jgi:cell division protein FtsL
MAQVARQQYNRYGYDGSAARVARPVRQPKPDVRVIPGRRSENPALQPISPKMALLFKYAIVAIAIIAVICSVRIWLSVTTVAALENVNSLQSELTTAQASTNELEIKHSILASSSRIESEATNLGMVAPSGVTYLKVILPNKIITNQDGSISLSGTLQNIQAYTALVAR